ncbi:hypothetical protein DFJ43DRAFT_827330 [Lentinula guzmanii]|uniref:Uncharacterized protein n=1 Tax=Lentinula guzmanii TaxID=2804957 RepID=A0AA38JNX1_9AGAR|nr:hypothetical protein DFJ43DRAFT_827330 [Lentinula guzmanii]
MALPLLSGSLFRHFLSLMDEILCMLYYSQSFHLAFTSCTCTYAIFIMLIHCTYILTTGRYLSFHLLVEFLITFGLSSILASLNRQF